MVYAADLKSAAERLAGSNPASRTKCAKKYLWIVLDIQFESIYNTHIERCGYGASGNTRPCQGLVVSSILTTRSNICPCS